LAAAKAKEHYKLSESLTTWEAANILFRSLLNTMQNNEQGLREGSDTEYLHDYRIAVRRTRTAITQIKHIFSKQDLEYIKGEFYWLGCITTPTRDIDVYLSNFDFYVDELPETMRQDLFPFKNFLQRHWQDEHQKMCDALDSDRYLKLIPKWQAILKQDTIKSLKTHDAEKPARKTANNRIRKLYNKVLREGRAIHKKSADEEFHELRKSCKKFRYLMEFFKDYYGEQEIKSLVKYLKKLQDNLGELQDLCVQTDQLDHFAEQMRNEEMDDPKTMVAMGVLVEKLKQRRGKVKSAFRHLFQQFSEPATIKEFRNTLDIN